MSDIRKVVVFFWNMTLRVIYYVRQKLRLLPFRRSIQVKELLRKRAEATSFEEWFMASKQLDIVRGKEDWKREERSSLYDFHLLKSRTLRLTELGTDSQSLMFLLRTGLLRNLGGLSNPKLFQKTHCETKELIKNYIESVLKNLEHIHQSNIPENEEFFRDMLQGFGRTALVMTGGASFAMFHLGVAKALIDRKMLPRIICGTSVGSLAAALICIHDDEELIDIFQNNSLNFDAFKSKPTSGSIRRKITRFLEHGYLLDIKILENFVSENVGDLTFLEAFEKTRRVLNITLKTNETKVPMIFNYLTAPNVLIRSAVCVASGSFGLFGRSSLLMKGKDGEIIQWSAGNLKWSESSHLPTKKLTQLFNVNNFITSQVSPSVLFLDKPDNRYKTIRRIIKFIGSEIAHRISQLYSIGLIPEFFTNFKKVFEKTHGDIHIIPDIAIRDYLSVLSNPTAELVKSCILKGEQAAWPHICHIWVRSAIELKLDQLINLQKSRKSAIKDIQVIRRRAQTVQ